jgi:hypothetical protein
LTKKYKIFINIQYMCISAGVVGIRGDRDKYSPVTEIKDGDMEYFGRRETGKLHPLISCPDIPKQSSLYNLIQAGLG